MTASRLLIQKNKQQTHPQMHPRMMWGNEENKLSLDEASHLELHALVIAKQGLSNSSRSSDKSLDKAPLLSEALLAYASSRTPDEDGCDCFEAARRVPVAECPNTLEPPSFAHILQTVVLQICGCCLRVSLWSGLLAGSSDVPPKIARRLLINLRGSRSVELFPRSFRRFREVGSGALARSASYCDALSSCPSISPRLVSKLSCVLSPLWLKPFLSWYRIAFPAPRCKSKTNSHGSL